MVENAEKKTTTVTAYNDTLYLAITKEVQRDSAYSDVGLARGDDVEIDIRDGWLCYRKLK